jgi:TP901 family phage tail tape measure protein
MSKVASAANTVGVDVDHMNAILATTISVTRQSPETVGTAYKTILARMTSISAGEDVEDGATLDSYTEKMAGFGINVLDATGHLRDMGDVIDEVGTKW